MLVEELKYGYIKASEEIENDLLEDGDEDEKDDDEDDEEAEEIES